MKRLLQALCAPLLAFAMHCCFAQAPQPPEIAARSYLLMDLTANQLLAAKDIDAGGARFADQADDAIPGV
jgi:D-alanyl-D-alanine carboxypeptidase (penicillin-binding protein 5/6)